MTRFLYILAAIFIVIWAVGFFFYSLGAIIHLLLVVAIITLLIRFFSRRDRRRYERTQKRKVANTNNY
jgi:membrane protein implicated in regulation of membrane protease activity